MARIIKTYPPTPQFNEDIIAQADKIQDIFMPEYSLKNFSFSSSENEVLYLQASCYALEDSKGVHIKMYERDKEETERLETEEVIIDELEFCDAVYSSIKKNQRLSNNSKISQICKDILNKFCTSTNRGDKWFFDTDYKGFGVITSGEEPIATIDTAVFHEKTVDLVHCVGNYNLNNVRDCSIKFWSCGSGFILEEFEMAKVINEEEGCCTYKIKLSGGKNLDDETYQTIAESRPTYEQGVEQFIEDRLKYLEEANNDEEEQENIYDLL